MSARAAAALSAAAARPGGYGCTTPVDGIPAAPGVLFSYSGEAGGDRCAPGATLDDREEAALAAAAAALAVAMPADSACSSSVASSSRTWLTAAATAIWPARLARRTTSCGDWSPSSSSTDSATDRYGLAGTTVLSCCCAVATARNAAAAASATGLAFLAL